MGKRGTASLGISLATVVAIALAGGSAYSVARGGVAPINCSDPAGTLSVTSTGTLRNEVYVGYRAADNSLRVKYWAASKDDGPFEFDTICPDPGSWKLITMKLGSGGDLVHLDGENMDAGFGPVPAEIKAKVQGEGTVDRLFGHAGADVLNGGSAFDELSGFEGDDYLIGGSSADRLLGGRGDDEIRSRDGGRQGDTVLCGAGEDEVVADKPDKLQGCEKVERR